MKIGLAQMAPHLGDIQKNLHRHQKMITAAGKKGVSLLVFPELSLTGYTLKDLVPEVALRPAEDPNFQKLLRLSRETALVFGFVEEKDNGLFYNSAAYLFGGKIAHIHRKVFLPTYGMFEEAKFFAQGKNFHTFASPQGNTGMMICYDFLHYGACYLLFAGGVDLILVLSAAPGRGFSEEETYATSYMWELMGEAMSRFSTAYVAYCNRVGFEDGISFAGGSFLYSPSGQLLAKASYTDEELLVADIDLDEVRQIRKKWPYKRDEKPEVISAALQRIINKYED